MRRKSRLLSSRTPTAKRNAFGHARRRLRQLVPAGHGRQWTARQDEQLIAAYRAGETLQAIAEGLGCEAFHVWDRVGALRRQGHELPVRKPRRTPERRELLARRRREGYTLRQLEVEFERTRGSITSQLRTLARLGYDLGPDGYGASPLPGDSRQKVIERGQ